MRTLLQYALLCTCVFSYAGDQVWPYSSPQCRNNIRQRKYTNSSDSTILKELQNNIAVPTVSKYEKQENPDFPALTQEACQRNLLSNLSDYEYICFVQKFLHHKSYLRASYLYNLTLFEQVLEGVVPREHTTDILGEIQSTRWKNNFIHKLLSSHQYISENVHEKLHNIIVTYTTPDMLQDTRNKRHDSVATIVLCKSGQEASIRKLVHTILDQGGTIEYNKHTLSRFKRERFISHVKQLRDATSSSDRYTYLDNIYNDVVNSTPKKRKASRNTSTSRKNRKTTTVATNGASSQQLRYAATSREQQQLPPISHVIPWLNNNT